MPCRHTQQIYREEGLKREDYINNFYILDKYRATYLGSLPPISPDNLFNSITYKAPPRQKTPGRPKKIRERRKQPSKIVHYSIYNREGHNRRSCAHHSPAESEAESSASSSSSGDSNGEMDGAQREELAEEARKALREYTRQEEMQAAKEDELERQIAEGGERLLNLALVSSDSEQKGGKTQLQQPNPPLLPRSLPRSPLRRRSYDFTSSEEETEEQAQERKFREEEEREREKEEKEDIERALRLLNEQDPEEADLAHQAELVPGSSFL